MAGDRKPVSAESRILSLARPRRMARRGRAFAFWLVACYGLIQFAVGILLDCWHPAAFETVLRTKREQVRELARRTQGQPLVVMLGSSRTDAAFQAGRLNGQPGPDGRPLAAYNFGVPAAGAMHEWLYLRDLLERGIRPRLLLVEFLPPLLNAPARGLVSEEAWTQARWLTGSQLRRLWPYITRRRRKVYQWLESRLAPAAAYRQDMRIWLNAELAPGGPQRINPQDEWGCRFPLLFTPEQCRERLDLTCNQYGPTLRDFRLGKGPCRALHHLLGCCRREGIPVALVIMPESSTFRSWYSPHARAVMQRLLEEARTRYGAEVIDAQHWLADEDFSDGHHPLPAGAERFTTRLIPEIKRLLARSAPAAQPSTLSLLRTRPPERSSQRTLFFNRGDQLNRLWARSASR